MKNYRKANVNDLNRILDIINQGKTKLRSQGVNQWQLDTPSEELLINDINQDQLFVVEVDQKVAGVFALVLTDDPNYEAIEGKWKTSNAYANIHRFAIAKEFYGTGLSDEMMKKCIELNPHPALRIDTHHDNVPMKKLISRNGFEYCGIIKLANNELRDAFEYVM